MQLKLPNQHNISMSIIKNTNAGCHTTRSVNSSMFLRNASIENQFDSSQCIMSCGTWNISNKADLCGGKLFVWIWPCTCQFSFMVSTSSNLNDQPFFPQEFTAQSHTMAALVDKIFTMVAAGFQGQGLKTEVFHPRTLLCLMVCLLPLCLKRFPTSL